MGLNLRQLTYIAVLLVLLFSNSTAVRAATGPAEPPPPKLVINGQEVIPDVPSVIIDGRTLVPIRIISETIGSTVDWDGETGTVDVRRESDHIRLTIGVQAAEANGKTILLDVPPRIIGDRTLVPLRFIAEAFGMKVDWDGDTRTVSVGRYRVATVDYVQTDGIPEIVITADGPVQFESRWDQGLGQIYLTLKNTEADPKALGSVPVSPLFFRRALVEKVSGSDAVRVSLHQTAHLKPVVSYADKKVIVGFTAEATNIGVYESFDNSRSQLMVATNLPVRPSFEYRKETNQFVVDFPNTTIQPGLVSGKGKFPVKSIAAGPGLLPGWSRLTLELEAPVFFQPIVNTSSQQVFVNLVGLSAPPPEKPPAALGKTVFIDPGHGGSEIGAKAASGLKEKDVNLGISLRLRDLLTAGGYKVIMSREDDLTVGLKERPNQANAAGADIFVSIHNNASTDSRDNGTEVWYYNSNPGSPKLAEAIRAAAKQGVGLRDRGVKNWEPFVVIKYTTMPAILFEGAFLSNPDEAALLADPNFRQRVARALYDGIAAYFEKNP